MSPVNKKPGGSDVTWKYRPSNQWQLPTKCAVLHSNRGSMFALETVNREHRVVRRPRHQEVPVKGIIVYRSWWGSCKRIAEAIGKGLSESGNEVEVVSIEDADTPDPTLDFVVIGAATRWPGAWPKIKRYAKRVLNAGPPGKPFATFSTGGTLTTEKPNAQTADILYDILEKGGFVPLAPALKVAIEGYHAPGRTEEDRGTLPDSEVARAEEFGRELGVKLSGR